VDSITVNESRFDLCRAVEADLPALVELLSDDPLGVARESTTSEPYLAAFREIDGDDHQMLLVVRSETADIVGTMQLTLIPGLARGGAKRLLIEAVRLAASARGGGLGAALFEWAHGYGRDRGAQLAQLTSDKSRTDAHRFYRRLGYEPSHEGFKRAL
jgi:GNAT superfamily N-acetyltransferase